MAKYDITIVVHGDDLTPAGVEAVYGAAATAGKFQYVPRISRISTTELIQRVLDAKVEGASENDVRRA